MEAKEVTQYIKENHPMHVDSHVHEAMAYAIGMVKEKCSEGYCTSEVKGIDILKFMIDDQPIPNLHTHSYGFHTRVGREVYGEFKYQYNKYIEKWIETT